MNQDLAIVAGMLVFVLSGVVAVSYLAGRPRHRISIWTQGGGEVRKTILKLTDHIMWRDPSDKKLVYIPLIREYAKQAGRGLSFYADATTGRLVRLKVRGKEQVVAQADAVDPRTVKFPASEWDVMDAKYLAAALEDGRERKLVAAQKAGLEAFTGVIMVVAVIGGLVLMAIAFMVFKLYQAKSG